MNQRLDSRFQEDARDAIRGSRTTIHFGGRSEVQGAQTNCAADAPAVLQGAEQALQNQRRRARADEELVRANEMVRKTRGRALRLREINESTAILPGDPKNLEEILETLERS